MKSAYLLRISALALMLATPAIMRADQAPAALTGVVSSTAEGAMEGVVVTAHKDGSIVSVSVTTDAQGRFAFPENRLEPGHYNLAIRAVGYDGHTLTVEFHTGRIYDHLGVSYQVYVEFMNAPSMGAYYNRYIRGRYN